MFTGIIQAVGEVAALEPSGGDVRLRIKTGALPLDDVALGDSICTNGVCLTVIELPGEQMLQRLALEHDQIMRGEQRVGVRGQPVGRKAGRVHRREKARIASAAHLVDLTRNLIAFHVDAPGPFAEIGGLDETGEIDAPEAERLCHDGGFSVGADQDQRARKPAFAPFNGRDHVDAATREF